jgi:hypothetical protein
MKIDVMDWYTGVSTKETIEVESLEEWIKEYAKPVLVYPPTYRLDNKWLVCTSNTGRFGQR